MSYGTDALAADLVAIGEIAGAALDAAYPGIQTQRSPGMWQVSIPGKGGVQGFGTAPTLREALELAQRSAPR